MISDAVPEKVRIAYALSVLRGKRIPESSFRIFGNIDIKKNDGYLKDGLILAARFAEIEKAEQEGEDQAATAVTEKAKPASEKRASSGR